MWRAAGAAALAMAMAMPAAAGEATARTEAAGLRFNLPTAWTRVPATSDVRAAQFRIPPADGAAAGELVLFFFGPGKGGSVDANLERWYGQFTQPDGRPSRDAATVTKRTVHGLEVTVVDLAGTYSGMGMHAEPAADSRMLAAIVSGEGGPWFWRAIGPRATIAAAKPTFDEMIGSLEAHH
jgi:hypothetical protein